MNIKYIVFIDSVDTYNNLMKYMYHCSYLENIFRKHILFLIISGVSFIVCGRLYLRHFNTNSCLVLKVCFFIF